MKKIFLKNTVTKEDVARLTPLIKSWVTLNEAYLLVDISITDVEKMIEIESGNRNREHLLKKLVGKWGSLRRKQLYERLGLES